MDGQSADPEKPTVKIQAAASLGLKATLLGVLRGPDRTTLILGALFALLAIASLIASIFSEKLWPPLLMFASVVGLGVLLWRACLPRTNEVPEGTSSTMIDVRQGLAFRGPVADPMAAFLRLREGLQGRQPLPAAHGKVTGPNISDASALEPLSEGARQVLHEEDQAAIGQHDAEVIRSLERLMSTLALTDAQTDTASGSMFGVEQTGSTADLPRERK